jgi:hypothetical protein
MSYILSSTVNELEKVTAGVKVQWLTVLIVIYCNELKFKHDSIRTDWFGIDIDT